MDNLLIANIIGYVEQNIPVFHEKRISKIGKLKLKEVLQKKNPYLFKAKYLQTAEAIMNLPALKGGVSCKRCIIYEVRSVRKLFNCGVCYHFS
jgi:hypothetical protein